MTFWNAYISGMLARRLRSSYSNRRILGSLKTRSYRGRVNKKEGEMADGAPTRMADATYGVWFPVPKKSAARGYTILSPKSMELTIPPATVSLSKTVTVNLSGCFDKAYAAERPAAPAPTIATRWVFMFMDKKLFVQRTIGRGKRGKGIQIHRSN